MGHPQPQNGARGRAPRGVFTPSDALISKPARGRRPCARFPRRCPHAPSAGPRRSPNGLSFGAGPLRGRGAREAREPLPTLAGELDGARTSLTRRFKSAWREPTAAPGAVLSCRRGVNELIVF